jgi:hypothetical protein
MSCSEVFLVVLEHGEGLVAVFTALLVQKLGHDRWPTEEYAHSALRVPMEAHTVAMGTARVLSRGELSGLSDHRYFNVV